MGYLKYVRALWKNPEKNVENYKEYLVQWRRDPVTLRITRPTRIDRARSLGYKAKDGFIVVRQRVNKGGRQRPKIRAGRRPRHMNRTLTLSKNYQQVAEERASKKYANCEVLNSYWVGEDGLHKWYEIILIDREHGNIQADRQLRNTAAKKGRATRGLTSAGRKGRGLRKKGLGAEKVR